MALPGGPQPGDIRPNPKIPAADQNQPGGQPAQQGQPGQNPPGQGEGCNVNQAVQSPPCPPPPPPPPGFELAEHAAIQAARAQANALADIAKAITDQFDPQLTDQQSEGDRVANGPHDMDGKPKDKWLDPPCPSPIDFGFIGFVDQIKAAQEANAEVSEQPFAFILGFINEVNGDFKVPGWFAAFWGGTIGSFGTALLNLVYSPVYTADLVWQCVTRACPAIRGTLFVNMFWGGLANKVSGLLGMDFRELRMQTQKTRQFVCPQQTLTSGESLNAALNDDMEKFEAQQWAKVDDQMVHAFDVNFNTLQYHHGVAEIQEMRRRQEIPDKAGFLRELRQAKVWKENRGEDLWNLSFRTIDVGLAYQLYNRYKLNPGEDGPDIYATLDGLKESILKQGFNETVVDPIAMLAEGPLSERRLETLYWENIVQLSDVYHISGQNGFDKQSSEWMVQYGSRMYMRHRRSILGLPAESAMARMFTDCIITQAEYSGFLTSMRFTPDEVSYAISECKKQRVYDQRKLVMGIIENEVKTLKITPQQGYAVLAALGIDASCALTVLEDIQKAEDVKSSCSRLTQSQLCKAAQDGLITYDNFILALEKCGYKGADINVIIAQCQLDSLKKQQQKANKNAAQNARNQKGAAASKAKLIAQLLADAKADMSEAGRLIKEVEPSSFEKLAKPKAQTSPGTSASSANTSVGSTSANPGTSSAQSQSPSQLPFVQPGSNGASSV